MVTLVVTTGTGSLDLYAQNLHRNLNMSKIYSDIYQGNAELFNASFFSLPAVKTLWRDMHFITMLNHEKGIVHLPNHHLGRYGLFLNKPYIITVHDLIRYFELRGHNGNFIHRPNFRDRVYLSLDYKGIRKAAHIIAVSHKTKSDLIQHMGIPEERISVVYEGIDQRLFRPVERRLVDYRYLLYVGTEQPRKNLRNLLRAFSKIKASDDFKDLKLVKVGGPGTQDFRKETLRAVRDLGLSNDVIFTGYVAEEDLSAYYSGAECFILPSFYEGFGFPPLEAMACGCPVIVSNVTSLPEIVGNAALLVNPEDIDNLAAAIQVILTDEGLRRELVSRGLEQASKFTWENAAIDTKKVYQAVADSVGARYIPAKVIEGTMPTLEN